MPPESWCGYSPTRWSGRRDADQLEQLDRPLARVAFGSSPGGGAAPRRPAGRPSAPGSGRSSAPGRSSRSPRPRIVAQPVLRRRPSRSTSPSARAAVDLGARRQQPEQRHRGHALAAARLPDDRQHLALLDARRTTSSTACTGPRRSRSARSGPRREQRQALSAPPRVERVAQAVAEQVERQRGEQHREAGEDRQPGRQRDERLRGRRASRPTTGSAAARRARGSDSSDSPMIAVGIAIVACTSSVLGHVGQQVAAQDHAVAGAVGDRRARRTPARAARASPPADHATSRGIASDRRARSWR